MRHEVDDAILERITKLLNMTVENGCSPNEAAVVAGKVQGLLTAHNLSIAHVQLHSDKKQDASAITQSKTVINCPGNRTYAWAIQLATQTAKLCYCHTVYSRGYNGQTGLTWVGEPTDIAVAQKLYEWLLEQGWLLVKVAWKARNKAIPASYLPWEQSWLIGYSAGLQTSMKENMAERNGHQAVSDLVVWKEGANKIYIAQNMRVRHTNLVAQTNRTDANAHAYGYKTGREMPLQRTEALD